MRETTAVKKIAECNNFIEILFNRFLIKSACYMKGKFFVSVIFSILISPNLFAQSFITEKNEAGAFAIVSSSQTTSIYVDENDDWFAHKTTLLLQKDIEMVTGKKPELITSLPASAKNIIIVGTIDRSSTIKKIIAAKKNLMLIA